MTDLWARLRSSPRNQALLVFALVIGGLAIGTAIQKLPSDSLQDELKWFTPTHRRRYPSCPGSPASAAHAVCVSTVNIALATDNGTRSSDYAFRGLYYHYMGANALALRDLDTAVSFGGVPRSIRVRVLAIRGAVRLETGDASGAAADYAQAIGFSDDEDTRWSMLYGRGWARMMLGEPAAAVSDFDAALRSLQRDEAELRSKSLAMYGFDSASQSREWHAIWARTFGRANAQCYASRAAAYRALGRDGKSLADYNVAISLMPENPSFYSGRARTEFAMGAWRAGFNDFWIRTKMVWHGI